MASLGGCLTITISINCFDLLITNRVVVIVCCGVGCEQVSPLGSVWIQTLLGELWVMHW